MEITYKDSILSTTADGNALLMLTIPKDQKRLYDDIRAFENDKLKVVTIDYFKEKKSKDANSGFWLMCDRIAKMLGTPKTTSMLRWSRNTAYGMTLFSQPKHGPSMKNAITIRQASILLKNTRYAMWWKVTARVVKVGLRSAVIQERQSTRKRILNHY